MPCRQLMRMRHFVDRRRVHEIRHDRNLSKEIKPTRRGGGQHEPLIGHGSCSADQDGTRSRRTGGPIVSSFVESDFLPNSVIRDRIGRGIVGPLLSTIGARPGRVKLNNDSSSLVKILEMPSGAKRKAFENALSQMIAHRAVSVEHFLAVPFDRRRVEHGPKFDVARHCTREFHGTVLRFGG